MKIAENAACACGMVEPKCETLGWKSAAEIRSMIAGVLSLEFAHNQVQDAGANNLFGVYFGAVAKAAGWSMILGTGALPAVGTALGSVTEATAGNQPGYSRKAITWDFTQSRHAKTGTLQFTATGAWVSAVTWLGVTDGTTLFDVVALTSARQPAASGDFVQASLDLSL